MKLVLRPVSIDDLPVLFEQQSDPESNQLAAVHPRSEAAFHQHWQAILADSHVIARAIVVDGMLVGSVNVFPMEGRSAVGYWIAREHWGRGIATRALALLLEEVKERPITAWVADTNAASCRVLEKCGFQVEGTLESAGSDRYVACTERIYRLD
jgi:RimJ/RimL family protein N-acetyltransferase